MVKKRFSEHAVVAKKKEILEGKKKELLFVGRLGTSTSPGILSGKDRYVWKRLWPKPVRGALKGVEALRPERRTRSHWERAAASMYIEKKLVPDSSGKRGGRVKKLFRLRLSRIREKVFNKGKGNSGRKRVNWGRRNRFEKQVVTIARSQDNKDDTHPEKRHSKDHSASFPEELHTGKGRFIEGRGDRETQ